MLNNIKTNDKCACAELYSLKKYLIVFKLQTLAAKYLSVYS